MLMVCHHLSPRVPEDVAFAESRIRPETMAAEDVLHDLGVISMYASDSQAMGRVGENFTRLFQTADKMRQFKGKLPEDSPDHDNFRVLRYLAKLTINPAITHGISPLGRLAGTRQTGRHRAVAAGQFRRQAQADHQRRHDLLGGNGRSQWFNTHRRAVLLPSHVRRHGQGSCQDVADLRVPGGA